MPATARDRALLALRLGLGGTFALAGFDHTFGGHGVITSALAFLPGGPEPAATLLSAAELAAGLMLLAGLLVRAAVAITLLVNVGAIAVYLAGPRGALLYQDVAMVGAALALLAAGAGALSLDARLAPRAGRWRGLLGPSARERAGWRALRLGLAATLLLGAFLAFQLGVDGYAVLDTRLPFAGAPVAALAAAAAGALVLLGLSPRAAAGLALLLGPLALLALGVQGGFTSYVVFLLPTLAAAAAHGLRGPEPWGLPALLPRRRAQAAPVAWALAALVVAATIVAASGPPAAPGALAPTRAPRVVALELAAGEALLGEGEAWVGQVPVRSLALQQMVATLTWVDDEPASAPDEFTLELVPPPGLYAGAPAEGAGGRLEIRYPVYRAPPPGGPELGIGDWHVRVYLRSAGDASTLGVLPGAFDEANDFQLRVTATVFEA